MTDVLCWHRLKIRASGLETCSNCGVQVSECPCVSARVPNGKCEICNGSGWASVVRSGAARFREMAGLGECEVVPLEDWL